MTIVIELTLTVDPSVDLSASIVAVLSAVSGIDGVQLSSLDVDSVAPAISTDADADE